MTVIPTQPDLRRHLFKPGDRVTTASRIPTGTVQDYPADAAVLSVLFDGEQQATAFYVPEELHLLHLVEPAPAPEEPADSDATDYQSSAYLAAVNLLFLTELLDQRHDVTLDIGWDTGGGRLTTIHLESSAGFDAAAALAAGIGLTTTTARTYQADVHHQWSGDRHGLPVRIVWIEKGTAVSATVPA